jgi:uncharacterized membrane protein
METDSRSSITSPSIPRWLWGVSIVSSICLLLLNVWEWTKDKSRWPGFLLAGGVFLLGIVGFFASQRGQMYKIGTILAIILMLSYIAVTLLVK